MRILPVDIERITELYDRGLYLQAYDGARSIAPLAEWEGTEARLIAGRLAAMLGAPKLARRLHLRAWRADRHDPQAIYYYTRALWDWRGAWRAWGFARRHPELSGAPIRIEAEWLGLRASLFGQLRDFDLAYEMIGRAEQLAPENPWIWVEKSSLLEYEDRYEEALAAANQSLQLRPLYRPAIQAATHLLGLLDREDEARDCLARATRHLECPALQIQLAQMLIDAGDHARAREHLELAVRLSPLMEEEVRQWLDGRRSDAAYLCGDLEAAAALAEGTKSSFFEEIAKRLRQATPEMRRVLLPVGFVRQHHVTCAPATLTMISRYWRMPAEHLEIAEEICYGGTSDHSERKWAEQNGWLAREFRVNWDDAVRLIDRGIPFTLATVDPGSAHLQAVIGYDERRGTLLIRDPYSPSLGEGLGTEMLEHYRSTGPRGMLLAPNGSAPQGNGGLRNWPDGVEPLEASLYDKLHAVQHALAHHDRAAADETWQAMSGEAPGHRLTLNARLAIASYDEDQHQALACIEELLGKYPDDANLKLQKVACLRMLARRSERLAYLKTICSDEKSDPLLWQQYAQELSEDAGESRTVSRLLHRSFRARPLEAHNFYLLANLRWSQRIFNEALELYRLAACLKDTNEQYVQSYFVASRHLRQTAAAMEFLEQRFQRFGRNSGFPARTLSWACEQTGESTRALEALTEGLKLRPEDGDLLLYASDVFARHGDFDQASALLVKAEGRASRTQILRGAAAVATYRGELSEALALWLQVLEAEPLAIDGNRHAAQLLAETEGQESALDFLQAAADRFPHSLPLHQLLIELLRDDPEAAEQVLRHITEIEPVNAWARRELGYKLCQQRRYEEALEEARLATRLEPDNPFGQCVIGTIYSESGDFAQARESYRGALRLSVDTEYAIGELIANSHTLDERLESLEFIRRELIRQVTFGDGLLAYRQVARMTLSDDETLSLMEEALGARPDLWQAWSAVVHQLVDLQRADEALPLAQQAAERFPLTPKIWLDLAHVHQVQCHHAGVVEALERARRINPAWSTATQQLAEAHQRNGEFARARELMEQAIAYAPLEYSNYGYLAEVLWLMGEKDAALERLQQALMLEPGYDWAWRALREWSPQSQDSGVALEFAREMARNRPGQARSWLVLAQTEGQNLAQRLEAIERAIELDPSLIEAHVLRSKLLTSMRRYDEARLACHPELFGENLPPDLICAEAGVDAERGDLRAAIERLEELVEDEPNHFLAWNLLADWYRATDSRARYLEAANRMVRLVPHRSMPLGYLSEAQLLNQDLSGARETLRRALALDPSYEFAGATLFDLQLDDQDLEGAEETLKILRLQVGGDGTMLRELRLAGRRGDFAAARECLRALCLSPSSNPALVAQAIELQLGGAWNAIEDEVLEEALGSPEANSQAGVAWVARRIVRGELDRCAARLGALDCRRELWRPAVIAFLWGLARAKEKSRLRRFVAREREALRRHSQVWAAAGYALCSIGDYRSAVDWMSDWPDRAASPEQPLEAWMLWNLALALRETGRDRESAEVSARALMLPADSLSQSHRLLITLDEMLRGELNRAEAGLRSINEPTLREWDRRLWQILTIWRDHHHESRTHRETLDRLWRLFSEIDGFGRSFPLLRLYRRVVLSLARESGSYALLLLTVVRLLRLTLSGWWPGSETILEAEFHPN